MLCSLVSLPLAFQALGSVLPVGPRAAHAMMEIGAPVEVADSAATVARRAALAARWVQNEGFYQQADTKMMAEDFVFMGPVVGPLNAADYLGTLGVFKVYDAFPDISVSCSEFTQDPSEPNRFWGVIRVRGTHTAPLNLGSAKIPATGKQMVVGPQAAPAHS